MHIIDPMTDKESTCDHIWFQIRTNENELGKSKSAVVNNKSLEFSVTLPQMVLLISIIKYFIGDRKIE